MVCKFLKLYVESPVNLRFILTMWYVNEEFRVKTTKKAQSFILTMWYVNLKNME